jgi:protease I
MTTNAPLRGKKIAILATNGFEQSELEVPLDALRRAGGEVSIVSLDHDPIVGTIHHEKGRGVPVDLDLSEADADRFDALVLPGGVANPDTLRTHPQVIAFVRAFGTAGKPISAICHGPWTLIDADLVDGKQVTSWPSLRTDLVNAGAHWSDREVVRDGMLVTSRKPADLPAFVRETIASITSSAPAP